MQCSHHQQFTYLLPVEWCASSWTEERERKWRRQEKAQDKWQGCFWVMNKWETPFGIQTNQPLSPRTSFSHSASVEKTAADRWGGIMGSGCSGELQWDSWVACALWVSSQLLPRSCAGPRHYRQNRLHGYQGEDCLCTAPCACSRQAYQPERGSVPSNWKGCSVERSQEEIRPAELSRKKFEFRRLGEVWEHKLTSLSKEEKKRSISLDFLTSLLPMQILF